MHAGIPGRPLCHHRRRERRDQGTRGTDQRNNGHFTKETVVVADKDKKEIYSASYKLNATTNPCDITMTSRVESSAGEIAGA